MSDLVNLQVTLSVNVPCMKRRESNNEYQYDIEQLISAEGIDSVSTNSTVISAEEI